MSSAASSAAPSDMAIFYLNEPFMHALVPTLAGHHIIELNAQQQLIERHLRGGRILLAHLGGIERLEARWTNRAPGGSPRDVVFELYDTFGSCGFDSADGGNKALKSTAGFEAAMEATKARSRAAGKLSTDDWVHDDVETTFVANDVREANAASATGR